LRCGTIPPRQGAVRLRRPGLLILTRQDVHALRRPRWTRRASRTAAWSLVTAAARS
jgi:hypothetical protein